MNKMPKLAKRLFFIWNHSFLKYIKQNYQHKQQTISCIINVILIVCSSRASGTVYTAIDIATGQEVRHTVMLKKQHSSTVADSYFLA